jgi:hypothetical protein
MLGNGVKQGEIGSMQQRLQQTVAAKRPAAVSQNTDT